MTSGVYERKYDQSVNFRKSSFLKEIIILNLKCQCGQKVIAFFKCKPLCRECFGKIKQKKKYKLKGGKK